MHFSSIWPIDRTLSGATTLGQSEVGSDGNEGVLCIPQSSSITGTSLSDYLVWNPGHLLREGESYLSAEMQLVYSTAPADWAIYIYFCLKFLCLYVCKHNQTITEQSKIFIWAIDLELSKLENKTIFSTVYHWKIFL